MLVPLPIQRGTSLDRRNVIGWFNARERQIAKVAPSQWINEFHLITIIEAAPRGCVELRKIILAHTKKETIKPTWLRRKLLSTNMLIHKLAHQDDPCVRECLVIVGAQDAPPSPGSTKLPTSSRWGQQ